MLNLLICGIYGKMGCNIRELAAEDSEIQVVCGVDTSTSAKTELPVYSSFSEVNESVDAVIDFSSPSILCDELEWAKTEHVPIVLGSTGYSADDIKHIDTYAKDIPVFRTANFSLGINLLVRLVRESVQTLGEKYDIEIIEKHHRLKSDAPSGTALMLAESASSALGGKKNFLFGREGITCRRGNEIGIHAVRGGTITGEHEVIFAGGDEIITLSHSAHSKKIFAAGAIGAAKWLVGKPAGLYDMNDLVDSLYSTIGNR